MFSTWHQDSRGCEERYPEMIPFLNEQNGEPLTPEESVQNGESFYVRRIGAKWGNLLRQKNQC